MVKTAWHKKIDEYRKKHKNVSYRDAMVALGDKTKKKKPKKDVKKRPKIISKSFTKDEIKKIRMKHLRKFFKEFRKDFKMSANGKPLTKQSLIHKLETLGLVDDFRNNYL